MDHIDPEDGAPKAGGGGKGTADDDDPYLRLLGETARAHARLRGRGQRAEQEIERSWSSVCAVSVRAWRALGEEGVEALVATAVRRGLVPSPGRARSPNPLQPLVRIAAGPLERPATVSRAATVAAHIVREGLEVEQVLAPDRKFWAVYDQIKAKPQAAGAGRRGPGQVTVRLAPALLADFHARKVMLALTWTGSSVSVAALPHDAGTGAPEGALGREDAQAVAPEGASPRAAAQEAPASGLGAPGGGSPTPSQGQEDGAVPAGPPPGPGPEAEAGAGASLPPAPPLLPGPQAHAGTLGAPAAGARSGAGPASPAPPPAAGTTGAAGDAGGPPVCTIIFGRNVKVHNAHDFHMLAAAGKFEKIPQSTGPVWAWRGMPFPELPAILARHEGRLLPPETAAPGGTPQ